MKQRSGNDRSFDRVPRTEPRVCHHCSSYRNRVTPVRVVHLMPDAGFALPEVLKRPAFIIPARWAGPHRSEEPFCQMPDSAHSWLPGSELVSCSEQRGDGLCVGDATV